MKKFILMATLTIVFFTTLFGGEIKNAFVAKILALKAKEYITSEHVVEAFKAKKYYSATELDTIFRTAYHASRNKAFIDLFGGQGVKEKGAEGWYTSYDLGAELRVLAIAKFKQELHTGNRLQDLYTQLRPALLEEVKKDGSVKVFQVLVVQAIARFEQVKTDAGRQLIMEDESLVEDRRHAYMKEVRAMLGKNESADAIAKKLLVESGTKKTKKASTPSESVRDTDFAKFALRRWDEGREDLVNKYLTVLRQMQKDLAEIN